MGAHIAELAEGVHELWPPVALELFLEEVNVDEDIGQCVLVHQWGVVACDKVLGNVYVHKVRWDTMQERTMRHSARYSTALRYASSLYVSLMTSVSTTVVNQFTSSYRYMLGELSRVVGVQSYSERPKKSSSLEVIEAFTLANARVSVLANDWEALTRIVPPRWDELDERA